MPARVEVVAGADAPLIVSDGMPDDKLLSRFVGAAQKLEREGASAIVSTCGFLVTLQSDIAASVRVPVLLSALSLAPLVRAICPGRIGVLTASSRALGQTALLAAGLDPEETAVAGLENVPAFADTILVTKRQQPRAFDQEAVSRAVTARAVALTKAQPDLTALILECGNLPPYAEAIRAATGLPVFHLVDAATSLVAAMRVST
ncbi:MAG: aspartate/glutamate racemase family protein [Pseudomonadota bacterium]